MHFGVYETVGDTVAHLEHGQCGVHVLQPSAKKREKQNYGMNECMNE